MANPKIVNLGKAVRLQRKDKNLTLKELAEKTGISQGMLSLIENGGASPSIASIVKIAEALEVRLSTLFLDVDSDDGICVLRSHERKIAPPRRQGARYSYEYLAKLKDSNSIEPFLVSFGHRGEGDFYFHRGEEFLYVIEGQVEFRTPDKVFLLNHGDSIHFISHIPHTFKGVGRTKAKCITIIVDQE